MQPVRQTPKHELAATRLRDGMLEGRWSGSLPGVLRLAAELDVSPHTVRRALRQLEAEGALTGCGLGRSRSIAAPGRAKASPGRLRVAILRHDANLEDNPQTSLILTEIAHSLEAAGHEVSFCKKSQIELKHDVRRLTRQLADTSADAWIVEAGSRPLLEWCSNQRTSCLALYGRATNQPLASAGVNAESAYRAATRHLVALGHRRIVLIVREPLRQPTPGLCPRAFLAELSEHGIQTSSYNLPDWEETPKGFTHLLESLFRKTPPTALIIDETPRFIAAVAYLVRRGIDVPGQVSLVSTDCDGSLGWCYPEFAHMRWDNRIIVRRVVRWVDAVRKGKPDRNLTNYPAEFIPGASTGPVRKGSKP